MSSERESFLSQLLQNKKSKLQPTQTKVTSTDGKVSIYGNQGSEAISTSTGSYGFVVDTKPDLSVGTVFPWLLISSQDVPNDPSLLQASGVTHILSLLPGFVLSESVTSFVPSQNHLCLELYDEEGSKLSSDEVGRALDFIKCVKLVDSAKVLVHCNAGISRAPSVVLTYLIKCEKLSFDEACAMVRKSRPSMKPNDGFLKQLRTMNFSNH